MKKLYYCVILLFALSIFSYADPNESEPEKKIPENVSEVTEGKKAEFDPEEELVEWAKAVWEDCKRIVFVNDEKFNVFLEIIYNQDNEPCQYSKEALGSFRYFLLTHFLVEAHELYKSSNIAGKQQIAMKLFLVGLAANCYTVESFTNETPNKSDFCKFIFKVLDDSYSFDPKPLSGEEESEYKDIFKKRQCKVNWRIAKQVLDYRLCIEHNANWKKRYLDFLYLTRIFVSSAELNEEMPENVSEDDEGKKPEFNPEEELAKQAFEKCKETIFDSMETFNEFLKVVYNQDNKICQYSGESFSSFRCFLLNSFLKEAEKRYESSDKVGKLQIAMKSFFIGLAANCYTVENFTNETPNQSDFFKFVCYSMKDSYICNLSGEEKKTDSSSQEDWERGPYKVDYHVAKQLMNCDAYVEANEKLMGQYWAFLDQTQIMECVF